MLVYTMLVRAVLSTGVMTIMAGDWSGPPPGSLSMKSLWVAARSLSVIGRYRPAAKLTVVGSIK